MILEDLEIYKELPQEYRFGQGSQFLEAADSVGANIAEGFGRYHYKDSLRFYYNSRGSLLELKHCNTIFHQRSLANAEKIRRMTELVKTEHLKLNGFINSLNSRVLKP